MKSLNGCLEKCRGKFDCYEQKTCLRSGNSTYKPERRRVRKRNKHIGDGAAADAMEGMTGQQAYTINTFYVIIDKS